MDAREGPEPRAHGRDVGHDELALGRAVHEGLEAREQLRLRAARPADVAPLVRPVHHLLKQRARRALALRRARGRAQGGAARRGRAGERNLKHVDETRVQKAHRAVAGLFNVEAQCPRRRNLRGEECRGGWVARQAAASVAGAAGGARHDPLAEDSALVVDLRESGRGGIQRFFQHPRLPPRKCA